MRERGGLGGEGQGLGLASDGISKACASPTIVIISVFLPGITTARAFVLHSLLLCY
jgi:hypothetical protein